MAGISIPNAPRIRPLAIPRNQSELPRLVNEIEDNFQSIILYLERLRNLLQDTIEAGNE